MSAKFLHVFGDENPELQKQIGCMNGIFQLFDRQCLLIGGRSNHKHKWLSSGQTYSDSSSLLAEKSDCSPLVILDKSPRKNFFENQRISMESSRSSFSSSSCSSSFSSLDCNRSMQDPLSCDQIIFPDKSSQDPTKLKSSDMDTRPGDIQNAMEESTSKDPNGLSVKTSTKKEVKNHQLNHRDAPRSVQISKSRGSCLHGTSRMPLDFDESLQVLLKLKEAPRNFSAALEPTRSSYEGKHTSWCSVSREAPRFSYDAKEFSYSESSKHASELREAPRLSLDSKQRSVMGWYLEAELNSALKDSEKTSTTERSGMASNLQQEMVGHMRHSNIITKLMGLEAMPSLSSTSQEPMELSKSITSKGCMLSSGRRNNDSPQPSELHSCSMKNSLRKHTSKSKVPIETAPWRQPQQRLRVTKESAFGLSEAALKHKAESDHCKIAMMSKELEFMHGSKDLTALKQILDTMEEKVVLERKKSEDHNTGAPAQNNAKTSKEKILKSGKVRNERIAHSHISLLRGNATTAHRSPIVIIKPVSSVIPSEKKKSDLDSKMVRECTWKASLRETTCQPLLSTDHYSTKTPSKMAQGSSRPQRPSRENNGASVKNAASSLSPRMHQRKLEMEKTLHLPPSPSLDWKKPHRHSSNSHSSESVSPRGKLGRKHMQMLENNDRLSEVSSETRSINQQVDRVSVQSDGNVSLRSQVGIEATSADGSAEMNLASNQQSRETNNVAALLKENKFSANLSEDVSNLDTATTTPEQPSPVSVLDASCYGDNLLPSPIKRVLTTFQDDEIRAAKSETSTSGLSTEVNHKRLVEIEILVKKLSQLSSANGETQAIDHIAALCEGQKPEHRYVSEILLVSGLLTKDLASEQGCTWALELHPSRYLINPDLFLVLEQTKSNLFSKLQHCQRKQELAKYNREKIQRKLVFDVVNEVLVQKLELASIGPLSCIHSRYRKLSASIPSSQRLLRELCSEIDQLQVVSLKCENCDDDDDDDRLIMGEDVLQRSQGWEGFRMEVLELALEIESYVFKVLIDEVVCGELATALQCKPSRRR